MMSNPVPQADKCRCQALKAAVVKYPMTDDAKMWAENPGSRFLNIYIRL